MLSSCQTDDFPCYLEGRILVLSFFNVSDHNKRPEEKKNSFEFAQMSFGNKGVEEECLLACAKKRAQFTAKLNSGVVDLNEKKKSQISFHL